MEGLPCDVHFRFLGFADPRDLGAAACVAAPWKEEAASRWPALMQARIRDTWQTKPAALNWLEDKLIQGPTAQELLESPQLLHVPILLTLNKDDPEEPTRREQVR